MLSARIAVVAAILVASAAVADDPVKPNFSGTWHLDLSRSDLEIDPPDSSTFVILHADPEWKLERTHVYNRKPDVLVIELLTDGSPSLVESGRMMSESSLAWDGTELILRWNQYVNSKLLGSGQVHYSLADDGQTFIAKERMVSNRGTHNNRWVFSRSN